MGRLMDSLLQNQFTLKEVCLMRRLELISASLLLTFLTGVGPFARATAQEKVVQITVPNSAPVPAVTAIANAPQKPERSAPFQIFAPPTCAATAPNSMRKNNDVAETKSVRLCDGETSVVTNGKMAPTENDAAETAAAWIGRAF